MSWVEVDPKDRFTLSQGILITRRLRRQSAAPPNTFSQTRRLVPPLQGGTGVVANQLLPGDPDNIEDYRVKQWFGTIPLGTVDDEGEREIKVWLHQCVRGLRMTIPKWKLKTELPVLSAFRKFVHDVMEVVPVQFNLPTDFVNTNIFAKRFMFANIHSTYDLVGNLVPKHVHTDLPTMLLKHNGDDLLIRLAAIGVVDMYTFTIMSCLVHQRHESHIPILLLALGLPKDSTSAKALIQLMKRSVVRTMHCLGHESLIARVLFHVQLFSAVQKVLWRAELTNPMPRIEEANEPADASAFDAIVIAKLAVL